MKKFLTTLLFFTGLIVLTPRASADCQERVFLGYDRCGRPVYEYVTRPTYYQPRQTYYYQTPTRYQSYDYGYRGYSQQSRCQEPRSRFSVHFGF